MFRYTAFISYSHRDRAWGDWLHKALEAYRVPRRLMGGPGRDGAIPRRLYPVFRDREELPSSADLGSQIRDALRDSACLLVICSPNAAGSRWVNEEILTFKRLGREDRILAIIVDGEPNASNTGAVDPATECFPAALLARLGPDGQPGAERIEPLAADARPSGDGRDSARLKIIAGVLGITYETLKQRELEAARRRARIARSIAGGMLLLALAALTAGTIAWSELFTARERLRTAQKQESRTLLEKVKDAKPEIAVPALLAALPRSIDDQGDRPLVLEVVAQLGIASASFTDVTRIDVQPAEQLEDFQLAGAADYLLARTGPVPGTVAVFKVPRGERIREWRFAQGVHAAAITDDGTRVVTAARGQSDIFVHTVLDGTADQRYSLQEALGQGGKIQSIDSVRFDHAARGLAALVRGRRQAALIRVDLTTRATRLFNIPPNHEVKKLIFDPTDRYLVGQGDFGVLVYDLGRSEADPVWRLDARTTSAALFTPDSLLVAREDGGTDSFAPGTWERLPGLLGETNQGIVIAADRLGQTLLTRVTAASGYKVFARQSTTPVLVLTNELSSLSLGDLSWDGKWLALESMGGDGKTVILGSSIKLLPTRAPATSASLTQLTRNAPITVARFTRDGRLVTSTAAGEVSVTKGGDDTALLRTHCGCGTVKEVFPDATADRALVVGTDSAVMFGLQSLNEQIRIPLATLSPEWMAADDALNWLVLGGQTVTAISVADQKAHEIAVGKTPFSFPLAGMLWVAPDGKRVVFVEDDDIHWLAPGDTPAQEQKFPLGGVPQHSAMDREGRRLAVSLSDNHLEVIDLDKKSAVFSLPDVGFVASMTFAGKNDRFLLVHTMDLGVRIFDVDNNHDLAQLKLPSGLPVETDLVAPVGESSALAVLLGVDAGTPTGRAMIFDLESGLPFATLRLLRPDSIGAGLLNTTGTGIAATAAPDGRHVFIYREGQIAALAEIPGMNWQAVIDNACDSIDHPLSAVDRERYHLTEAVPTFLEKMIGRVPYVGKLIFPEASVRKPCGRQL